MANAKTEENGMVEVQFTAERSTVECLKSHAKGLGISFGEYLRKIFVEKVESTAFRARKVESTGPAELKHGA